MSIIKSLSVGNGDMFYIRHGSDNFTIIDCSMAEADRSRIVAELERESSDKGITRFISTHPDNDHILGLEYLDNEMNILNFYCVKNQTTKSVSTADFSRYCQLRDSEAKAFYLYAGCSRKWMNRSENGERGSSGIDIYWPDISNEHFITALMLARLGLSPNNISPIIKYSLNGGASLLWMGDLETDFMENIESSLDIPPIDILFAPHHGRDTGRVPRSLLDRISPKLIVIGEAPSKHSRLRSIFSP